MELKLHPQTHSNIMVRLGLQHTSKFLEKMDTTFAQEWLEKMGQSTLRTNIHQEKPMPPKSNPNYPDKPGYGTVFYQAPEDKKHQAAPDFTGFVVAELDYKAGERIYFGLWQKQTKLGTTMFSVKEDTWLKKKKLEEQVPREVTPGYNKPRAKTYDADDENTVPF